MSVVCLIYAQHRTFPDPVGTSQLGHQRTTLWPEPWRAMTFGFWKHEQGGTLVQVNLWA